MLTQKTLPKNKLRASVMPKNIRLQLHQQEKKIWTFFFKYTHTTWKEAWYLGSYFDSWATTLSNWIWVIQHDFRSVFLWPHDIRVFCPFKGLTLRTFQSTKNYFKQIEFRQAWILWSFSKLNEAKEVLLKDLHGAWEGGRDLSHQEVCCCPGR